MADAEVAGSVAALIADIRRQTAYRKQMGSVAYDQLIAVLADPDAGHPINSIWATTLYPAVIETWLCAYPQWRVHVLALRRAVQGAQYHGVKIPLEDRKVTGPDFDTREERDMA